MAVQGNSRAKLIGNARQAVQVAQTALHQRAERKPRLRKLQHAEAKLRRGYGTEKCLLHCVQA